MRNSAFRYGGDQPSALARLLSELSGHRWCKAFGSHHRMDPADVGNCILWPQHETLFVEQDETVFKLSEKTLINKALKHSFANALTKAKLDPIKSMLYSI